ncbi:transglycosylase SLT domain-containing protein [Bacillus infantis]|uniref:transglycosylase SLT domain-containing protein n=1 Tax=Bacillus infantis TaxID=324767 RepID=UPI003CF4AC2F
MKKMLMLLLLAGIAGGTSAHEAQAHVTDETKTKRLQYQIDGQETDLKVLGTYKGKSGVTYDSYSPAWKDAAKLAKLDEELLKNKHGEELSKLGKILIYPDYPAGKQVAGQYFAKYQFSGKDGQLSPGRIIHLYGGDKNTSVASMARTLSHEYGHHVTFYMLVEKEDVLPENWLESDYAKARELDNYPKVHTDDEGAYDWYLPEVLAEDYVQLMGSETAVSTEAQYNGELPTPFDLSNLQSYWNRMLGSRYAPNQPLALSLTDYRKNGSNTWDLQFATDSRTSGEAYLSGQALNERYAPVALGRLGGQAGMDNWYTAGQYDSQSAWILTNQVQGAHFRLLQHEEQGFNKGSKTLTVSYQNVAASKTAPPAAEEEQTPAIEVNEELSIVKKKELLTAAAKKYNIPAEVLKAIAYNESGMNQFQKDGTPLITDDGGIGMMQVTLSAEEAAAKGYDRNRLITDTAYNIEAGAKILKEKWNYTFIPRINNHDPNIIENWYFAIMAYNGLSMRNDPDNTQGKTPYQEKIFQIIEDNSLVDLTAIPEFDVEYKDPARPEIMSFPSGKLSYQWSGMDTETSHLFEKGDKVYTWNHMQSTSNLRDAVDGGRAASVPHFSPLTIVSGPYESANANNHFVYYEVKGSNVQGFIASTLIHKGNITNFSDVKDQETREAVAYLQMNNILNGYPDGRFGVNDPLLRRQAAAILIKELGLTLPAGYKTKATDMKPGDLGYEAMVIAEANGIFGQGGVLNGKGELTRAQMASILVRAYSNVMDKPLSNAKFSDIDEDFWNYKDINTLAYNKITIADPYRASESVKRSQFAIFLKRILDRE